MKPINIELLIFKPFMKALVFAALCLSSHACVYRFTNSHLVRPRGIRTVAIEAVYDTSHEVIPHERLWFAMQKAFAANGRLEVVSRDEADALVRTHITKASIGPTGDPIGDISIKDPDSYTGDPAPYFYYQALTIAREYSQYEMIAIAVDVELINLHTGELLMRRSFGGASKFTDFQYENKHPERQPIAGAFLEYEESINTRMTQMADSIASQAVSSVLGVF